MQRKIDSFDKTKINYDISKQESDFFVVFLHGAGGNLTAWNTERKFMHKKGISTLAIDLRGHGKSDRPTSLNEYTLDKFAKDIHSVLKYEKIRKFILCGHCFGGIITIYFQKLFPSLSKGYILVDTTHKAPKLLNFVFRRKSAILSFVNKFFEMANSDNKKYLHENFKKFEGTGDYNFKRIYSDIIHTSLKSWFFTYQKISSFDGTKILRQMRKPTLIIQGGDDRIFNTKEAQKIKELVKKSTLKIIPDANHIIVINNPKILEEAIFSFLMEFKEFKNVLKK